MANDPAAFNATIIAIQQNQVTLSPYLLSGLLSLKLQGLTETDVATLSNALKNNTSVYYLDLSSNSIGAIGASALAQALQVNTELEYLYLLSNSIGDNGASALAQALQVNKALVNLELDGNSIGESGAVALAQALQVNTALQWLNLYFNSISDSGASAIAQALQVNTGLQYLNLALNSISDSGASAFTKALQCNYVLQQLDLDITLPTQLSGYLQRNVNCAAAAAQCPILVFEPPATIFPNTMIPLRSANLRITNVQRNQTLLGNFTVNAVSNGNFVNATQEVLTEFSQSAVNASQVFIKTNNSGLPFSCNITASFGGLSTCAIPLLFNVSMTTTTSITTSTTTSRPFTTTRTPTTVTSSSVTSALPLTTTSSAFFSSTRQSPTTSLSTTSTSVVKNSGGLGAQSTNLGSIIGGVVGGVVGAATVGALAFLLNRRRHKRTAQIAALPAHVTGNDVTSMTTNPVYVGAAVNPAAADESGMTANSVYARSPHTTDGRNLVYASSDPATAPRTWDPSAYEVQPSSSPPLPLRKK